MSTFQEWVIHTVFWVFAGTAAVRGLIVLIWLVKIFWLRVSCPVRPDGSRKPLRFYHRKTV